MANSFISGNVEKECRNRKNNGHPSKQELVSLIKLSWWLIVLILIKFDRKILSKGTTNNDLGGGGGPEEI